MDVIDGIIAHDVKSNDDVKPFNYAKLNDGQSNDVKLNDVKSYDTKSVYDAISSSPLVIHGVSSS